MTALKAPCPHGHYDPHWLADIVRLPEEYCPGGVLLPPDTLVIVKQECEWPGWAIDVFGRGPTFLTAPQILDALAAAQQVSDAG